MANRVFQKCLDLPQCLSNASLFRKNTWLLPLTFIWLDYTQQKTGLFLELRESTDQIIRSAEV